MFEQSGSGPRSISLSELEEKDRQLILDECAADPYGLDPTGFVNRIRSTVALNGERGVDVAQDFYALPRELVERVALIP